jgi:hypothetical protein
MTSHCANPECAVPLRYLRDGRIFQFEIRNGFSKVADDKPITVGDRVRRVSHFWLCGQCSSKLTLAFDAIKGVVIRPRAAA